MIEHALAAAEKKWPVFPCVPGTKRPLIPDMLNAASTDPEVIGEWWSKWPEANIGISTGPAGLVIVDIDVKNGKNGMEEWCFLLFNAGLNHEPRTYEVDTPSGGSHIYWLANPAVPITSAPLTEGIDIRADKGSCMAAGSVNEDGEPYVIRRRIDPRPLPIWLRQAIRKARLSKTELEVRRPASKAFTPASAITDPRKYAETTIAKIIDQYMLNPSSSRGYKNADLNDAAFQLKWHVDNDRVPLQQAWDALYVAGQQIGMPAREVEYQLRRVLEQGK